MSLDTFHEAVCGLHPDLATSKQLSNTLANLKQDLMQSEAPGGTISKFSREDDALRNSCAMTANAAFNLGSSTW